MNRSFEGRVSFIGGGNMAQALIGGLLSEGVKASRIMVSEPVAALREQLAERGIVATQDNRQAVLQADVVVLAVKPQVMEQVLTALADVIGGRLVISIAAGLSTATLARWMGGYDRVVRAMPNTPALIQAGATGLYAPAHIAEQDRIDAANILGSAGMVVWVDDEELMHAVTAVSGSGPAYFFYLMEAMIAAGQQLGLDERMARDLTLQTALGAAQMAVTGGEHPTRLRQNVTSPNGTTQAAIEALDAQQVHQAMIQALQAAAARSQELSQALDQA